MDCEKADICKKKLMNIITVALINVKRILYVLYSIDPTPSNEKKGKTM